jgi:hypothetical protein
MPSVTNMTDGMADCCNVIRRVICRDLHSAHILTHNRSGSLAWRCGPL